LGADGKRHDIHAHGLSRRHVPSKIILERWSVAFQADHDAAAIDLPVVYKKSIVVFRSLYSLTRLLPTWSLRKRLLKSKINGNALKLECRIVPAGTSGQDGSIPLDRSYEFDQAASKTINLHSVATSTGRISTKVEYRLNCEFHIDDSEALLSSQFLSNDAHFLDRRVLGGTFPERRGSTDTVNTQERPHSVSSDPQRSQLYSRQYDDARRVSSTRRDPVERRPSVAPIQPFKTPSLSASPSLEHLAPSPRHIARTPSLTSVDRVRNQQYSSNRSQQGRVEGPSSPLSISPRAAPLPKRFSSSFGQRTNSFTGRRRASQTSETTTPLENSTRSFTRSPSIGLGEAVAEENDDLGDFLKLLDSRHPLSGAQFREEGIAASKLLEKSSMDKTTNDLAKYQQYREQHSQLEESLMQASHMLQPSTSAASHTSRTRQLAHTPIVPSRLSDHSLPLRDSEAAQDLPRAYSDEVDSLSHSRRHRNRDPWLENSPSAAVCESSADGPSGLAIIKPDSDYLSDLPGVSGEQVRLGPPDPFSPNLAQHPYGERASAAEDDELFFAMSDIHLRS
jgi:autophagy-related protein 13